jgi:pimeloyl-ACP methyl ester carboxylesterase
MRHLRSCILLLLVAAMVLPAAAPATADNGSYASIVGTWMGPLAVMGTQLRIVFNLSVADDGSLQATLDSPDQGANGIPVDTATYEDGILKLGINSINGEYEGTLDTASDEFKGQWKQSGMTFELNLKRQSGAIEDNRPQEPREPYPYKAEEVKYVNKMSAGVELAGTLTIPEGTGPFPAVVLITGSGAEDRNETVFGHRPFLVLADYLTRQGIAVLRSDDRGVGGSTGDYATATSEDFATDALAGVEFLQTRPEIDGKHIGLIGHSEGGIIAPMAALQSDHVAFIVLLAGPGVNGEEILYQQGQDILRAMGAGEEAMKAQLDSQKQIFTVVKTEKDPAAAESILRKLMHEIASTQPDAQKMTKEELDAQIEVQLGFVNSPWFRFFLTYDPAPTLSKVQVPVLALNGSLDLQVNPGVNLPAIEQALKAGGNQNYTVKELDGLNHLFQHATTGAVSEYSQIEETFAEEAMALIAGWVKTHSQ